MTTIDRFSAAGLTSIDHVLDAVKWEVIDSPNRGDGSLPWITHQGVLTIGDFTLRAFVLNDGRRIFAAEDLERFFAGLT